MPMLPSLCTKNWQKKSVAWNQMTKATEHAESIATSAWNSSMEGCTDFTAASIPSQPYQVQQVRLAHLNHLRSLSPTQDYAWLMGPCNSAWENKVPGIKASKPLFFVDEIRAFTSSRRAPTVLYRVSRREKSSNKDSHYKAFERMQKQIPLLVSNHVSPQCRSCGQFVFILWKRINETTTANDKVDLALLGTLQIGWILHGPPTGHINIINTLCQIVGKKINKTTESLNNSRMTTKAFVCQGTPQQVRHPMKGIFQDKSEDTPSPQ